MCHRELLVFRTRGVVYGPAREQVLLGLFSSQPPIFFSDSFFFSQIFIDKEEVTVVGDADEFILVGSDDFIHDRAGGMVYCGRSVGQGHRWRTIAGRGISQKGE